MNNTYRRLIDRYRGYLFSKGTSQNLKSELSKLSSHSNDSIGFDTTTGRQLIGLRSLSNSSRASSASLTNLNAGKFLIVCMIILFNNIFSRFNHSGE